MYLIIITFENLSKHPSHFDGCLFYPSYINIISFDKLSSLTSLHMIPFENISQILVFSQIIANYRGLFRKPFYIL